MKLAMKTAAVFALGLIWLHSPALAQSAGAQPGDGRNTELLLALELQGGGDKIASQINGELCVGRQCGIVEMPTDELGAGEGLGIGLGSFVPVGQGNLGIEMIAGGLRGGLLATSGQTAVISFFYLRAQAVFNRQSALRIGIGPALHLLGKYQISDGGLSRDFDPALGLRYQMDWDLITGISLGVYLQAMEYKNDAESFGADSLGFAVTVRL